MTITFEYVGQGGMTYLELCQQLMIECGIPGTMTTVLNQTGELRRVTSWISQAWKEIQNMHEDWEFLRASYLNFNVLYPTQGVTFTTTAGQSVYPLGTTAGTTCMVDPDTFGKWDQYSFRCFTTSITNRQDEIPMDPVPYDSWRDAYMMGALRQVQTRPVVVAISPTAAVCIGPPSNGNYSIEGDYWFAPQTLTVDDDVPQGLQGQYQMLVVYRAMFKYAAFEAAPDVKARADSEYWPMIRQLESKWGPRVMVGGALA